jgi:hypothetical protein
MMLITLWNFKNYFIKERVGGERRKKRKKSKIPTWKPVSTT